MTMYSDTPVPIHLPAQEHHVQIREPRSAIELTLAALNKPRIFAPGRLLSAEQTGCPLPGLPVSKPSLRASPENLRQETPLGGTGSAKLAVGARPPPQRPCKCLYSTQATSRTFSKIGRLRFHILGTDATKSNAGASIAPKYGHTIRSTVSYSGKS